MRLFRIPFITLCDSRPEGFVSDWKFAQKDVSEELALLHHFSFKKPQGSGEVRFVITVREFASPPQVQFARFFAQADNQFIHKIAPILPTPCGHSILDSPPPSA